MKNDGFQPGRRSLRVEPRLVADHAAGRRGDPGVGDLRREALEPGATSGSGRRSP